MKDIEPPKSGPALSELLDRPLNKGIVITGDVTISASDVESLGLGAALLLSPAETIRRLKKERDALHSAHCLSPTPGFRGVYGTAP